MPIYKRTRPSGEEFFVISVSATDRFGERIQRTKYKDNLKQAEKAERELYTEVQDLIQNGPKVSFGSFLPTYLDYIENKRQKTKGTVDSEKSLLEKHVLPYFKDLALGEIQTSNVELILDEVLAHHSSQTKRHALNYIRALFNLAQRKGLVHENPCTGVESITVVHRSKIILNREQIQKFLVAAKEYYPEWYSILLAVLHCTFRASELRGLKWGDIVWNEGNDLIHVRRVLNVKGGIKPWPKNKQARIVPISPEPKEVLLELKALRQPDDDEWIFERHVELMRSEQAKIVRAICRIAGIPECTFHNLRGAAITNLYREGLNTGEVMKIAGHKRLSSTEIYYQESGEMVKGRTGHIRFMKETEEEKKK